MKHKHADLIHAWADGAEIQTRYGDGKWEDIKNPVFHEQYKYRIKPEEKKPVVRWLWANAKGQFLYGMYSESEIDKTLGDRTKVFKLEWSRTEFPE